jgi:PAS domain S-box-containing protein
MVEDSPDDAELVEIQLAKAGCEVTTTRVTSAQEMQAALAASEWDVVIADYNVPGFGALPALEVLTRSGLDIPFIVLSGIVSDELAVAAMRAGAHDYLRKDNLSRLLPAIERETQEAATRARNRRMEAMLRLQIAALDSAANAIVITDRKGNMQWVNAAFTRLTGYSAAEAIGRNPRVLKSGEHDDQLYKKLWDTILSGAVWRGEIINRRKDGTFYFEHMTITPVRTNGAISHFVAVKEDISARKQAEEALSAAQAQLRTVTETMASGVFRCDRNLRYLWVSHAYAEWLNRQPAELIGLTIPDVIGSAGYSVMRPYVERVLTGERVDYEAEVTYGGSGFRWVNAVYAPTFDQAGAPDGLVAVVNDVTRHKKLEETLQQQAEMLRLSFDAIIVWRLNGTIESWNRGAEQLYGYTEHEAVGCSPHDLLKTVNAVPWSQVEATMREAGIWEGELRHTTREGREVIVASRHQIVTGSDGVQRVLESNRDITERKQAEEALRLSEERLSLAIQAADLGTWDWDIPADRLVWSRRCRELFGIPPGTPMTYERFLQALHPSDREITDGAMRRAIARHEEYAVESRTVWPDGSLHWVVSRGKAAYDAAGNAIRMRGAAMDITDRKLSEQALIKGEKLATVGRMAATIAHEINNPLSSAINALYLVRTDPSLHQSLRGNIDIAEQELGRVSHITKQTLGFYKEVGHPSAVDLPEILDSIVNLYEPRLRNKNISLIRNYRSSASISAVEGEIRQIISNLIANSIDALPVGGKLQLRVLGPQTLHGYRRMVRMTIADDGEGIAPENLKRIFEPFFTTKLSIGTGLGLWVTSELIKKHEGRLRLKSRVGKGTVLTVWLPMERRGQERKTA